MPSVAQTVRPARPARPVRLSKAARPARAARAVKPAAARKPVRKPIAAGRAAANQARPRKRKTWRDYTPQELREMSDADYARLAPPGGARILTYAEVMARTPPLKPGERSAHEALREFMAPIREYRIWCAKKGIAVPDEMDPSLMEERAK